MAVTRGSKRPLFVSRHVLRRTYADSAGLRATLIGLLALSLAPACGSRSDSTSAASAAASSSASSSDKAGAPEKTPDAEPPQAAGDPATPLVLTPGTGPLHTGALPAEATMVAHVDLAALETTPLWTENRALMEREAATKRALDAMRRCELPLAGLTALDIGVDPRGDRLAVIISGAGVGDKAKLECVHRELPDQLGAGTWHFDQDESGRERLRMDDQPALVGLLADDDTLVLASAPWLPAIARALASPEAAPSDRSRATAGPLRPALARLDSARHIWFAGVLPPDAIKALREQGIDGIADVAGTLDLSDGLAIELSARAKSDEQAASMLTRARSQLDNVRPLAKLTGVPERVIDSVQLTEGEDAAIQLRAALTMEDIREVRAALNERAKPGPPPTGK